MHTLPRLTILLLYTSLFTTISFCQTDSLGNSYKNVEDLYGANQIPLNGKLSEYFPSKVIGWPYYLNDKFHKGAITIHDTEYKNIELKYNIFEQNLEVLYISPQNTRYSLIPPADFISSFKIGEQQFEKLTFNEEAKFFQIIHKGNIECLYYWYKKSSESNEEGRYAKLEYHNTKRKSYIVMNGNLYPYKSKSSFVKLFPKTHKSAIKKFMKTNQIKVHNADDNTIRSLIVFCQDLLNE